MEIKKKLIHCELSLRIIACELGIIIGLIVAAEI